MDGFFQSQNSIRGKDVENVYTNLNLTVGNHDCFENNSTIVIIGMADKGRRTCLLTCISNCSSKSNRYDSYDFISRNYILSFLRIKKTPSETEKKISIQYTNFVTKH